jgi:hypothetical protein
MKTTLILALALVLGTGTTFGVMGCNKPATTEKKVTTETKTPEGSKTETTTETKTEAPKAAEPEKK